VNCAKSEHCGLDCRGSVRTLRQKLVEFLRGNMMEPSGDVKRAQASDQTNLQSYSDPPVSQNVGCCAHSGCGDSQAAVFWELLRRLTPLSSEALQDMWFFCQVRGKPQVRAG
jgi:hypothetical protein